MLKFMLLICSANILISGQVRPRNELKDAFRRFEQFVPTLIGYNFTKKDEEMYETGAKLEDVYLKIDELILKHGYPVEKHEVTTEDGYILRMYRIPGGGNGVGRPIFLMHGLLMSADDWVSMGPQSGIGYMLAAEGFDVWFGNARGTQHSRAHTSLSTTSPAFWDFSWDEIGRYDLPAMIDYVLTTTNQSQLIYVGHSQGTTSFFVLTSQKPQYNEKISLMVALAPAAAIPNLKSPILQFVNYGTLLHVDTAFAYIRRLGLYEVTQSNDITTMFASTACAKSAVARALCDNLVIVMCGLNYPQLNFTMLPTVLNHLAPGVAFKQIEHYAQSVVTQRFARFDYGAKKNLELYGSRVAPKYNLSAITTPVALYYSAGDWLTSIPDVRHLRAKLKNVVEFYKVPDDNFRHTDFTYAKDLRELVFIPMLKQIKQSML